MIQKTLIYSVNYVKHQEPPTFPIEMKEYVAVLEAQFELQMSKQLWTSLVRNLTVCYQLEVLT